ncbi:putative acetyltransferase [Fictibacillus macauensis ZFHKF-1]|uniref:Putative acetyltransferase n=1 Tax=Fictibacillus macauensis ZFHKF-1 TaxID=1196324 RepID=I8UGP9_9BACL|nr:GNAT family protein [Fictibacillus macauensis]EIT86070.1 putative acetyltransferase [Fictibacillus macauensis ZFHKF-1]
MIILSNQKVTLTEASEEDLQQLYYWKYEEPLQEAKKWNGPYIKEPYLTYAEFVKEWQDRSSIADHVPSSLLIKDNEYCIGIVESHWIDRGTDWLETGIVIYDPHYWNGGYGTEAYSLWIDFLFRHTSLPRLGMSTWSGNKRMIEVARKLGMKEEACIRQARIVDGQRFDAIKMGILRSEWEKLYIKP